VGKNKFHYFWPPRKTLEKSRSPPPGKILPTPMLEAPHCNWQASSDGVRGNHFVSVHGNQRRIWRHRPSKFCALWISWGIVLEVPDIFRKLVGAYSWVTEILDHSISFSAHVRNANPVTRVVNFILKPEPGSTFIFEAQFRSENQIYRVGQDVRNRGVLVA